MCFSRDVSSFLLQVTKTVIYGTAQGVGFYFGVIMMRQCQSFLPSNVGNDFDYTSWFTTLLFLDDNDDDKKKRHKKSRCSDDDTTDIEKKNNSDNGEDGVKNDAISHNKCEDTAPTRSLSFININYPNPHSIPFKNDDTGHYSTASSSRSASIGTETDIPPHTTTATTTKPHRSTERYLEMLIHNVAHTDLVLSLGGTTTTTTDDSTFVSNEWLSTEDPILCRPRFSAFDLFSRRIYDHLTNCHPPDPLKDIISFPRYQRNETSVRHSLFTPPPDQKAQLPVGLRLKVPIERRNDLPRLRIRGRDVERIDGSEEIMKCHRRSLEVKRGSSSSSAFEEDEIVKKMSFPESDKDDLHINAVFFPLLAALVPRWDKSITEKFNSSSSSSTRHKTREVKKVVVLVSGVGTPRNYTHSLTGNSTEMVSHLLELYLTLLHPDITVVKVHSSTNIFRYDENISFAKGELLPCINAYRDAHAMGAPYPDETTKTTASSGMGGSDDDGGGCRKDFDPDWIKSFGVTLSFADGSPARTHAIQSALRGYRPVYFHVWQLKTFWHETKISDDDVEVHSFEDMCTVPAIDSSLATGHIRTLLTEIKSYKDDFLTSFYTSSDIESFWLRKSKKPVLAVLLVEINGITRLYRGSNMEVSMPTGSLCAERNAIGSALAHNPGLKRGDLKMVAVLAVPLPTPLCREIGGAAAAARISVGAPMTTSGGMVRSSSCTSFIEQEKSFSRCNRQLQLPHEDYAPSSANADDLESSWVKCLNDEKFSMEPSSSSSVEQQQQHQQQREMTPLRRINLYTKLSSSGDNDNGDACGTATIIDDDVPDNGTTTKSKLSMGGGGRKAKKTVVVHSPTDINPLAPCGSCNEWLKKIAELNPYFKVITFTDADCNGVYINSCQD